MFTQDKAPASSSKLAAPTLKKLIVVVPESSIENIVVEALSAASNILPDGAVPLPAPQRVNLEYGVDVPIANLPFTVALLEITSAEVEAVPVTARLVVVALVPVAFAKVRFWRVVEPRVKISPR